MKYEITAVVRVWIKEEWQVEAIKKFLEIFPLESEVQIKDVLMWENEKE